MYKRKILAVAVATALGTAAVTVSAQDNPAGTMYGNVEVYGRTYPEFTVLSGSGATAVGTPGMSTLAATATGLDLQRRNSVDASNSRLGFRGKEDLGAGVSAIWQIESTVAIDQGGTTFATRESFVGLRGGFGTVRLGFMDTVYKELGDPIRFMGIASGNHVSTSSIISSRMGFGNSSSASFHLRQPNGLWYQTPSMGGVTLYSQYSPDTQESAQGGVQTNRKFWSNGIRYRSGPLYLALAHEYHRDFFGGSNSAPAAVRNTADTSAHSRDTSTRATAMVTFGNSRISLDVAQLKYNEYGMSAAGRFNNYENKRGAVTWEQRWGDRWRTALAYAKAQAGSCSLTGSAVCDTNGLGGNMIALGGEYSFSKKTALFAFIRS